MPDRLTCNCKNLFRRDSSVESATICWFEYFIHGIVLNSQLVERSEPVQSTTRGQSGRAAEVEFKEEETIIWKSTLPQTNYVKEIPNRGLNVGLLLRIRVRICVRATAGLDFDSGQFQMRKRALLAGPSYAVGLALSKFAASLIKEEKKEERKRKRQRTTDGDGRDASEGGGDSGGEGSTNRVEAKITPIALDEGDSNGILNETSHGNEPASPFDLEEDCGSDARELQREWSLPKDTLVAIKMMCAQFPKIEQSSVRPFVLRSQLYSSVSDRTTADRELEELKQQQVVRIFKLNSGKDDFAVMLTDDYLKQIEAAKHQILSKRPDEDLAVFDWFQSRVLCAHTGASIRHSHLVLLLSQAGQVKDKQISLLINSGILVRQLADDSTYWFGIPEIGSLLRSLTQGRKELTSFLARRRYKEMIQAVLEKKRLRTSQFDMRFHIRDLLGSGHIYTISTPVGPLIRLSSD